MPVKIAINGFGRIGRYIVRACQGRDDVSLIAINSRADAEVLAHLLRYDSVHGKFSGTVKPDKDGLLINGKPVRVTRSDNGLKELPWKELDVDIVLESTGKFRNRAETESHIKAGAKKVIITAPGKNIDGSFVIGVNEKTYDPAQHHIISNASCTTNCLAPVAKVLHDNFKILRGVMTTIHSYTMDQRLLDGSHKDLRRARAAAMSMIPTTTGAAGAVGLVIPDLKGKLDGIAVRVPTPNVSLVDFVCEVEKATSIEKVNAAMQKAAEGELKGILEYSTEPLVSIDYNSNPASSIFDAAITNVIDERLVKVLSWYDNESGYAHRIVDLAVYIWKKGL